MFNSIDRKFRGAINAFKESRQAREEREEIYTFTAELKLCQDKYIFEFKTIAKFTFSIKVLTRTGLSLNIVENTPRYFRKILH